MADYIDRAELLKMQYNASNFCSPEFAEMAVDVRDIEDAPAADVAPVRHGRWISYGIGFGFSYKCSACGYIDGYPFNDRHNYCPGCGAKMDDKGGT